MAKTAVAESPGMKELPGWIDRYIEVHEQRAELDDLSKRLKDGPEREAKDAILSIMRSNDMLSAKLPNGTVSRRISKQIRIKDHEGFCRYMFERMREAYENGRPLVDHLLTEKRPLKNENVSWAREALEARGVSGEDFNLMNEALAERGLAMFLVEDVVHTKTKG